MLLAPGILVAEHRTAGYRRLSELSVLVLVGVTGVGKSATLEALAATGFEFSLLPDRRDITDAVIFQGEPIQNRDQRFARTAAFRAAHPGGMAEALERLLVSESLAEPILFDGLRGLNEVQHATTAFPKAKFVALDAPDTVRVQRLLGRGDAFDMVGRSAALENAGIRQRLNAISGLDQVFTAAEQAQLCQLEGEAENITAKVSIVVTERQHYDPKAANQYLSALSGNRSLYVDTSFEGPQAVAKKILNWWRS